MHCPNCLTLMYCSSEIHRIAPGIDRMDLHCFNYRDNVIQKLEREEKIFVQSNKCTGQYVIVITNDPKPWIIVRYGLYITKDDCTLLLEGDWYQNWTSVKLDGRRGKELHRSSFIPLSSGDDMHLQAKQIAERFFKILAFI